MLKYKAEYFRAEAGKEVSHMWCGIIQWCHLALSHCLLSHCHWLSVLYMVTSVVSLVVWIYKVTTVVSLSPTYVGISTTVSVSNCLLSSTAIKAALYSMIVLSGYMTAVTGVIRTCSDGQLRL